MKKTQRKKWLKILLIIGFFGIIAGLVLMSGPTKHKQDSISVRVEPPSPVPTEPQESIPNPAVGEEASQVPSVMPPPPLHFEPETKRPHGPARIAIIIDDVGLDLKGSQRAIRLPGYITLSFMPYASRLREQTREAHENGHELMLHMPMEPVGHVDPGPGALIVSLPLDELKQRLDDALGSFVGFDGMNNHMGSKFTAYPEGMELVMGELKPRHLFFLDSRTSAQTVGESIARKNDVPTIARDVFLDDNESLVSIKAQLAQTERIAQHKGYAVAIGHPHAVTLDALESWIDDVQKRGFILVPVHDLINLQPAATH